MTKRRGCGTRKAGGLYAVCELIEDGMAVEMFVLDPAIPWEGGPFQGVQLRERQDGSGIYDLIDWVGESFYPTVPDFVEEGREMGFSTKIPVNKSIDYSLLTPYESTLCYVHAKTIPQFKHQVREQDDQIPMYAGGCQHSRTWSSASPRQPCTFNLWDLSAFVDCPGHEATYGDNSAEIQTPSVRYSVRTPIQPMLRQNVEHITPYAPGIFLRVPLTRFEFIGDALTEDAAGVLGDHAETNVLLCEE
jgi:hypothetical protein